MTVRRLLAAALPVLALVLSGCTSLQGTEGKEYVGGSGQVLEIPVADRGAPVESSGDTVDGGTLDVASYRGKVLVVNFWWSGCVPCRTEMPMLVEASTEIGAGAALIGVNIRDSSADTAASFERTRQVTFPSLFSPGGQALLDFSDDEVSPRAVPSTMVLDREGRVAALISGQVPTKLTLIDVVQKIVDESPGASTDGALDG